MPAIAAARARLTHQSYAGADLAVRPRPRGYRSISETGCPECFLLACVNTTEDDPPIPEAPEPARRAIDDHAAAAPVDAAEGHHRLPHLAELARVHAQL